MKRRDFLLRASATAVATSAVSSLRGQQQSSAPTKRSIAEGGPLKAPPNGTIRVAFAISDNVTPIDVFGPWEVFQDVMLYDAKQQMQMPFDLFTVANTKKAVSSGSLKIVPTHTFDDAPEAKIVVVPAQTGSKELHQWLQKISGTADLVMSVCTGAFQLARAGLLDGKSATTHHDFLEKFEREFPKIKLERGLRFVEHEKVATSGGLSSGIDLALRVVERYYGREVAKATARYMEYESDAWTVS
jgi:transcriptional regulator GlxA family with amidase domain